MKKIAVGVARPVRIVTNGAVKGDRWGKIVDVRTGTVLHVGQLKYIKRVAIGRYNAVPLM